MPEGPRRPNLVVVRTGASSLHKKWPKDLGSADRSWDLLLSHFDEKSEPDCPDADIIVRQGAYKFSSCWRLFQDIPWLSTYKSVWFCDDDIMTSWSDIQKLFELFSEFGLDLAQPALTTDSYFSLPICLQQKNSVLRFTNFVEVMIPLFSAKALKTCLPTFENSMSGWGLDFVWAHLLGNPRHKLAIIDAVPVQHTRPVGSGAMYDHAKQIKIEPFDEMHEYLRRYGIDRPPLLEYGTIYLRTVLLDQEGTEVEARLKKLALSLLSAPPTSWQKMPDRWSAPSDWSGGSALFCKTPLFQAEDLAMSLGFTIHLSPDTSEKGSEILFLGHNSEKLRLLMSFEADNDQIYHLVIHVFDDKGGILTALWLAVPFNQPITFALQIVPAIGWIRAWFNGIVSGDAFVPAFHWSEVDQVRFGNEKLTGKISQFWMKPWSIEG